MLTQTRIKSDIDTVSTCSRTQGLLWTSVCTREEDTADDSGSVSSCKSGVSWTTTSSGRDPIRPNNSTAEDRSPAARANIVLGKCATVEAYVKAKMYG
jgi:hypothetical protein